MNLFKKDEKRLCGLFYIQTVLGSTFAVVWIYWMIYLLDKGFSYSVIGAALTIMGISIAILEVPTGALADAVSRKGSVITGLIGYALVLFVVPSLTSPTALTAVFALWGLPIALVSGVGEAWVVDNLRAENREDLIKEFYAKDTAIENLGAIVAASMSSVVVRLFGMDALWYIQGVALLISVLVLALQKEHFERKKIKIRKSFVETYTNVWKGATFTVKEKNVLFIMIAIFFITIGGELMVVCSKPFLEVIGVAREHFGYLSAVSAALCVGMPFLAKYLANLFKKEQYYLSLHSLLSGFVLVSVVMVKAPMMAAVLFVAMSIRQTSSSPVLEPFFHGFLPQKLRATIGSFRNMLYAVAALLGNVIIYAAADLTGPQVMLVIGGIIMLPSAICYLCVKSPSSRRTKGAE
jgi:predicted MFS family arabinose efflux permease